MARPFSAPRVRLAWLWPFARTRPQPPGFESPPSPEVELRIGQATLAAVRQHIEDATNGEEGAFLICGHARTGQLDLLLVRQWLPIPDSAVVSRDGEYGLEWNAEFSSEVLERAANLGGTLVLVHSHGGTSSPRLSDPDQNSAARLFPGVSRILRLPAGSVVLGERAASGEFWRDGHAYAVLKRLRVVGSPIEFWLPTPDKSSRPEPKHRHDRMIQAIGRRAEAQLAASSVAVVGLCGGGSHVCQQLAHMGVGRIVPIDHDVVKDVNLGRMVGSTAADVDTVLKTDVMLRLITSIDPGIRVHAVPNAFPAQATLTALKSVDLVVACVDSFVVREQINAFCRRYHLPLIDIGLGINTKDQKLLSAFGQLTVVLPDSACLRCGPLLSDEVLDRERRERPPGYDLNEEAEGAPQVVSMNGVLASEAANTALDFVTGYSGGRRTGGWWQYDGRVGSMIPATDPIRQRPNCPACAEQGHGDPA